MAPTFSEQLDGLVEKRTQELTLHRGWIRRTTWYIQQWFFVGPRAEIAHDGQVVNQFAERIKQRLAKKEEVSDIDKDNLVDVLALLECAKTEPDFGQAWSYINCADATLPLIISPDELNACTVRLEKADRRLPDDYKSALLGTDNAILFGAVTQWMEEHNADHALRKQILDAFEKISEATAPPAPSGTKMRYHLYAGQLVRAMLWNSINRQISLKLSLWRSIRNRLVFALLAFLGAVALWAVGHEKPFWPTVTPFVEIALLGFFGGMLSAFLTARDADVDIPSYELIRSRTSLRMLLGAAGALVVYSVGLWLFSEKLQNLLETNLFVFTSVGIVSGFSERLFIDTLEKASENLHLSGTTKPREEGKPFMHSKPAKKVAAEK
jgi:hypothetical protein